MVTKSEIKLFRGKHLQQVHIYALIAQIRYAFIVIFQCKLMFIEKLVDAKVGNEVGDEVSDDVGDIFLEVLIYAPSFCCPFYFFDYEVCFVIRQLKLNY